MEIIGIDVGGTKIAAARINNNEISQSITEPTNKQEPTAQIIQLINKLKTEHTIGVGIGVPTIVDRGLVLEARNIPTWQKEPLAQNVQEATGLPTYVANDANCFTAGTHHFGCAIDKKNIVGVIIGTGCGCGVILKGQLLIGSNGSIGEIGENPYLDSNLEYYASGKFFTKHNTTGEETFTKAQQGDAQALQLFEQYGHHVASAIITVQNAYDPDIIVLGGSVAQSYPFFKESMEQSIKKNIISRIFEKLDIRVENNPHIAVLGAAALVKNAQR